MNSVTGHPIAAAARPVAMPSSGRWARLQPWALPGLLALVVGLFLLVTPTWGRSGGTGLWHSSVLTDDLLLGPGVALPLLNLCVVAGVLLARRSPTLGVILTTLPFVTVLVTGAFVWGWWLGVLCVAVVAAVDGWRRAVPAGLVAVALSSAYAWLPIVALLPIGPVWAVAPRIYPEGTRPSVAGEAVITGLYVFWVVAAVAVAAALGIASRSRAESRSAAAATRQAAQSRAVTAERARIAHDLHDVVAHHVSLVVVRAESAPFVHPGLDESARAVLADIATDAREALRELRQVLAVIQRSEDAAPDLTPQPGAQDIATLVRSACAAGQDVTFTGSLDDVPAAPGYAIYRAAQEALTNARRHAPGQPVAMDARIVGAGHNRAAVLRVTNPVDADIPSSGLPGRGLAGMRERVEALGGTLTTAVSDDARTFVVEAHLPLAGSPIPEASEAGVGA